MHDHSQQDAERLRIYEELKALDKPTADAVREVYSRHGIQVWTMNEVVSYNLRRARQECGWSQERLAQVLIQATGKPWSNVTVNAAERARETGRTRRFDAGELVAFARTFGLPVAYFLLPPDVGPDEPAPEIITGAHEEWEHSTADCRWLLEWIEPYAPPREFVDRMRSLLKRYANRDWSPAQSMIRFGSLPVRPEELVSMLRQTAWAIETSVRGVSKPEADIRKELAANPDEAIDLVIKERARAEFAEEENIRLRTLLGGHRQGADTDDGETTAR